MERHDDEKSNLTFNDPAHTASREAAERTRATDPSTVPADAAKRSAAGMAAGTAAGAAAGATAGTLIAGPIGTIIGGIAGAVGGWWAGQGAANAAQSYTEEDERRYRALFESTPNRPADRSYDDFRTAYQLGYIARHNPNFTGRPFDEIEPELQRGWSDELRARYGEWTGMRGYVRAAYEGQPGEEPGSEAARRDRMEELQDRLPRDEGRRV
jgi:hypothetical protein